MLEKKREICDSAYKTYLKYLINVYATSTVYTFISTLIFTVLNKVCLYFC